MFDITSLRSSQSGWTCIPYRTIYILNTSTRRNGLLTIMQIVRMVWEASRWATKDEKHKIQPHGRGAGRNQVLAKWHNATLRTTGPITHTNMTMHLGIFWINMTCKYGYTPKPLKMFQGPRNSAPTAPRERSELPERSGSRADSSGKRPIVLWLLSLQIANRSRTV